MNRLLVILTVIIIYFSNISAKDFKLKNVQTYTNKNESSLPVLIPNLYRSQRLTIEFDIDASHTPDLIILFRFSNKNWQPYHNIFLTNQGRNIAYNLKYSVLPNTVIEARYHYKGEFPDKKGYVTFPFSGKWKYYITDSQDTSKIYYTGKFIVVYDSVVLNVSLKKEQLENKVYFPFDLAKIFNITTEFNLPDNMYPGYVDEVQIIENHKLNYPVTVERGTNTNTRQYYWNGDRKFTFIARDIRPGNEYREVNLMNVNKFNSRNVNAQFNGIEYSHFYKSLPPDLNGGSILMNYNNPFATYMNVRFSIRPPQEFFGDIFLVGAFNNWKLSPDYMLRNSMDIYSITLNLKRGIYDYQYVTGNLINGKIVDPNWFYLEGNNWNTVNEYYIFLYYQDPHYGGYDRIIGFNKILSN